MFHSKKHNKNTKSENVKPVQQIVQKYEDINLECELKFFKEFVESSKLTLKKIEERQNLNKSSLEFITKEVCDLKSSVDKFINVIRHAEINLDCRKEPTKKPSGNKVEVINSTNDEDIIKIKKKNNIIIHGICEPNDDWQWKTKELVQEFLEQKLDVKLEIQEAFPLGRTNKRTPILVKLKVWRDKLKVFKNCSKMRNNKNKISIVDDLTIDERISRARLWWKLNECKSRGEKAFFRGGNLIINGQLFMEEKDESVQSGILGQADMDGTQVGQKFANMHDQRNASDEPSTSTPRHDDSGEVSAEFLKARMDSRTDEDRNAILAKFEEEWRNSDLDDEDDDDFSARDTDPPSDYYDYDDYDD